MQPALTHSPDIILSDGEAFMMSEASPLGKPAAAGGVIEGWAPFRRIFDIVATGRRQSIMGASQIDSSSACAALLATPPITAWTTGSRATAHACSSSP